MKKQKIAEAMAKVLEDFGWEVTIPHSHSCLNCSYEINHQYFCPECGEKQEEYDDDIDERALIAVYKAGKKVDK